MAAQKKESDFDVIRDEQLVPNYDLPPLLVNAAGQTVTTPEQWMEVRRPEILSLFANLVYGGIPSPESPLTTEFVEDSVNPNFLNGKGVRKEVNIRFQNDRGHAEMTILVFTPKQASRPVPAFMMINFDDDKSDKMKLDLNGAPKLQNGVPIGEILDRGYGFVSVYQQDLVGHNEVAFERGIHPLFFKQQQSFPKAHEWGVLSACGWSAMRVLDYLEKDPDVDSGKVALMGHSKLGKAALWAAAQDQRFALVISANSGCAGAALWRRRFGETLEKMTTRFPYWLCANAQKFVGREDDLPVDQHMLLALVAPRPVYVASATNDAWADPRGEYLSAYHASPVYRLFGKRALTSPETPPADLALVEQSVGFHLKTGGHSIDKFDWERFLEFTDYHLKPSKQSDQ